MHPEWLPTCFNSWYITFLILNRFIVDLLSDIQCCPLHHDQARMLSVIHPPPPGTCSISSCFVLSLSLSATRFWLIKIQPACKWVLHSHTFRVDRRAAAGGVATVISRIKPESYAKERKGIYRRQKRQREWEPICPHTHVNKYQRSAADWASG